VVGPRRRVLVLLPHPAGLMQALIPARATDRRNGVVTDTAVELD